MRDWLKAIRENKGLRQSAVAAAVGISQPSYYNIENGERRPSVETAKKIANTLGFDWQLFYPDDPDESAKGDPGSAEGVGT